MQGGSAVPLVDGDREGWPTEAFVQVSEAEIGRAVRTDRWKYGVAAPTLHGWRGGMGEPASETYVERYLYDLASDPAESVNLVGRADYRDVADALRERLGERMRDAGENGFEIVPFENPGYREY